MIIYRATVKGFKESVRENRITRELESAFIEALGHKPQYKEKESWSSSLQYMERVIEQSNIPDDAAIFLEYYITGQGNRIDFFIAGHDQFGNRNYVIVELKRWAEAIATDREGVVQTYLGGGLKYTAHPSYQAWSYREKINDMNEGIYGNDIKGHACVYMHNYVKSKSEPLLDNRYNNYTTQAPIFFADDYEEFQQFLYEKVGSGKGDIILDLIESGKIRPSQQLIDHVVGLFKGNDEFILFNEQKVALSTIMNAAKEEKDTKKVIIVTGGPGTGKSVISFNAFGKLLNEGLNARFVAPNASFRNVMVEKLTSQNVASKARIKALFTGSASYYDTKEDEFDLLLCDESHRLKNGSAYQYFGDNQVEDVVKAARTSVFFIDDTQRIRPEDIGTVEEIRKVAERYGAEVEEVELTIQFRAAGANGFINWIQDVLQITDTGNFDGWDKEAFKFEILDSPLEVQRRITKKNEQGLNARMLAGYAWEWTSEKKGNKNGEYDDVVIDEHNFKMPWNARSMSTTWAINDQGVGQIGCVHTSQGLEFPYIGLIIGDDLKYDTVTNEIYAEYKEYKDKAGKKGLKDNNEKLTELVKNVYKVLFSRGMKGCYVYCRDKNLQAYLKKCLELTEKAGVKS